MKSNAWGAADRLGKGVQHLLTLFSRRQSIRRTLLVVLAVALIPLAVLSTAQGILRTERENAASDAELGAVVLRISQADRNPAMRAETLLELFSRMPTVVDGTSEPCAWLIETLAPNLPADLMLLRAGQNGTIDCATDPTWIGRPIPAQGLTTNAVQGDTSQTPTPLLVQSRPVVNGSVAAAVKLDRLQTPARSGRTGEADIWVLTDGGGRLLYSSAPVTWQSFDVTVPEGMAVRITDDGRRKWSYAHAILTGDAGADGAIHFLRLRPGVETFSTEWWFNLTFLALPLLALMLASLAIWVGTNHSILRWISKLRDVAGGIAGGNYRLPAELFDDAPAEIRSLASDVQRMARTISERDRTLTEALDRQTGLALELNHRVRNNLQLIASYLTLEAARTSGEEAARPIEQVRLRVSALALVHRLLYSRNEQPQVQADALLQSLADLLSDSFSMAPITVSSVGEPIGIDSAVPIVLWIIEAMAWRAHGAAPQAALDFQVADGNARLTLTIAGVRAAEGKQPRLLVALARQLGAKVQIEELSPGSCALALSVAASNLSREFRVNIGNNH